MKIGLRDLFLVGVIALGAIGLGANFVQTQSASAPQPITTKALDSALDPFVKSIDSSFQRDGRRPRWSRPKRLAT